MPRPLFNLVCSALFIGAMIGLYELLSLASTPFIDGLAVGCIGTAAVLWAFQKLGIQLF